MICDLFDMFRDFELGFLARMNLYFKYICVYFFSQNYKNKCDVLKLPISHFLPSIICDLFDVFRDFELGTLLFFSLKSMHTLVSYVSLLNFMAHTELYSNLETPKKLCPNNCNLAPTYNSSCLHLL